MLLYDPFNLPYAAPVTMMVFKFFEASSAYADLKKVARSLGEQ